MLKSLKKLVRGKRTPDTDALSSNVERQTQAGPTGPARAAPAAAEPEPAAAVPTFAFAPPQPEQLPGAAGRDVTISLALALSCTVVRDLLDLVGAEQEEAGAGGAGAGGSGGRAVVVPAVPSSITPLGLRLLDEWALRRQAAAAAAGAGAGAGEGAAAAAGAAAAPAPAPAAAWLPAFLAGHQQAALTTEAAAAADFLGCSSFLEAVTELQLARVVLAERSALDAFAAGGGRKALPREDRERRLSQAQLQHLPCCLAAAASTCGAGAGAGAGPSSGSAAAAAAVAAAAGAGGAPRLVDSGPLGRVVVMGPERMAALVEALCGCEWLAVCRPEREHVRRVLGQLGFRQCLTFRREGEREQADGRSAYLAVPLPALPGGGAEVTCVEVEAEAHDQGWSSYPADRGTYRNSWTWGELVLVGPGGKRVRAGDPGRLFTNKHAERTFQTHRVVQGPDSAVVQDLNERVYGGAGAAGAGGAGAGGARGQGYELQLLQCAAFPGWCHTMRRAAITVHFK
ncbi:hypothetical protein HXX76_004879 [Chlamydomonas incerta]|uniref:Uncharacterized protein n=1 Tax=Chlamydomonas incerta TaxID=51695 RepID=A0A835W8C8_CHLIN|nr:hypothetical protein HXX76_004879 [Chlamydomonas incerta]|eukprot:KAG2439526.1 hypothetical protein HXX76_004879 [Chlamydomonas incerta]